MMLPHQCYTGKSWPGPDFATIPIPRGKNVATCNIMLQPRIPGPESVGTGPGLREFPHSPSASARTTPVRPPPHTHPNPTLPPPRPPRTPPAPRSIAESPGGGGGPRGRAGQEGPRGREGGVGGVWGERVWFARSRWGNVGIPVTPARSQPIPVRVCEVVT